MQRKPILCIRWFCIYLRFICIKLTCTWLKLLLWIQLFTWMLRKAITEDFLKGVAYILGKIRWSRRFKAFKNKGLLVLDICVSMKYHFAMVLATGTHLLLTLVYSWVFQMLYTLVVLLPFLKSFCLHYSWKRYSVFLSFLTLEILPYYMVS